MAPVIQNRKIRFGIAGCGRISKNHFSSLEKHTEDLELVYVCDEDPAVLKEHESRYKVNTYLRLENMLQDEELELIAICTSSGLHPDQEELAARYGVNLMTEKPIATRMADGIQMI